MFGVMSPVCLEDLGYTPMEFHATFVDVYDLRRQSRQTNLQESFDSKG